MTFSEGYFQKVNLACTIKNFYSKVAAKQFAFSESPGPYPN